MKVKINSILVNSRKLKLNKRDYKMSILFQNNKI